MGLQLGLENLFLVAVDQGQQGYKITKWLDYGNVLMVAYIYWIICSSFEVSNVNPVTPRSD